MIRIETMAREHAGAVLEMMRGFYASPAVLTDGSEEIFWNDIENCLSDSPYLEGYVFTDDGTVVGYSMEAKGFSTEYGRPCVWIEDLYLEPPYRGRGLAAQLFSFLREKYPDEIFRLEAEEENESAIRAYRKSGFKILPYIEMFAMP